VPTAYYKFSALGQNLVIFLFQKIYRIGIDFLKEGKMPEKDCIIELHCSQEQLDS
jgi:hypothetical protein